MSLICEVSEIERRRLAIVDALISADEKPDTPTVPTAPELDNERLREVEHAVVELRLQVANAVARIDDLQNEPEPVVAAGSGRPSLLSDAASRALFGHS